MMTLLFVPISENMRTNESGHDRTSVMSGELNLNCWIIDDGANRIFPVEIAGTKTVGHLKKAIKAEKTPVFDHTPADALDLWQVSVRCFDASRFTPELWQVNIPADDGLPEAVSKLNLDAVKPLWSVKRLSGLFEAALFADENVHIVIRRPPNGVFRHLPPRILGYSE